VSLLILLSSASQSPLSAPSVVEKNAQNTKKVKRLELIKRLIKNAAKATNQSHLLKTLVVTEALSESISKAAVTFKLLKITLLAIYSSPIKKAVGSFIYNFKYFPAINQQLILKGFKVKSRTYIFNLLTGKA